MKDTMARAITNKKVGMNLTEGPIMKTLLAFSVPMIMGALIQQLYSMVDLVIIGKYVGTVGTVGVNIGGEIADYVAPVAMGFSTAGQIIISQVAGAKDDSKLKSTIGTLLSFMIVLSILLTAAALIICNPFLKLLQCPEEAWGQARAYMIITALGIPFIFTYNAICGVLRGMGEAKRPLLFIIVAAVVNIFLDILLVVGFHLEAAGTAIATVMSQLGACIAAFIYLWTKREVFEFELKRSYFKVDASILWLIIKVGIPQVVRSMLVRTSMLWVNSLANSYGLVVSAANSIGNKLLKFLEVFVQSVDSASATMIGQNLGARKIERAGKVTWNTLTAVLVCATCVSMLCVFCPSQMFCIFSDDEAVISTGVEFMRIMILHFYVSAVVGAFQAMVTGCGFVSLGFAIGILDGVVCKIGLSWLFVYPLNMGYRGLFWGVACSRILPAILCITYFFSGRWKTRKLLIDKR